MKRFGLTGFAAAIVMFVLGGAAPEAQAAEMLQAGFAYGGWGGPMGIGNGGWGYAGPTMAYTGYGMGGYGMGGYMGGGGWGYTGSCCSNIWAGYCAQQGCCGGCRVKHRHRALGCGAGPCCQPTCGAGACGADPCDVPSCGSPAPCGRRHLCHRRRRACGMGCGMGGGMTADCCGNGYGTGDGSTMGYGYQDGMAPGAYDNSQPVGPAPDAPAPAPETIDQPMPEGAANSST
jgi:hypothetical protein